MLKKILFITEKKENNFFEQKYMSYYDFVSLLPTESLIGKNDFNDISAVILDTDNISCNLCIFLLELKKYVLQEMPFVGITHEENQIILIDETKSFLNDVCTYDTKSLVFKKRIDNLINLFEAINVANKDSLTSAYNRGYIFELIKQDFSKEKYGILFFLDIDNFKSLNDTLGHHIGDVILIELCNALREIFVDDCKIGRFGGDEFIIYLRHQENLEIIKQYVDCIILKMNNLVINGLEIPVGCSVGIVEANADLEVEDFFHNADESLYEAKARGKNQYVIHGTFQENEIKYASKNFVSKYKQEEQRDLYQRLQQANEEIKMIYNSIPGGVYRGLQDTNYTLIQANDGFYSFLGYTKDEFVTKFNNSIKGVIYKDDLVSSNRQIKEQLALGDSFIVTHRIVTSSSAVKWITTTGKIMNDSKYLYCVFIDVTLQHKTDENSN